MIIKIGKNPTAQIVGSVKKSAIEGGGRIP